MSDELLHHRDLRRLHADAAARMNKDMADAQDPVEGFARVGVCAHCVVDMANDVLLTSAQQINVEPPRGPHVLPLVMQVFAYGIFLGMEIERERQ